MESNKNEESQGIVDTSEKDSSHLNFDNVDHDSVHSVASVKNMASATVLDSEDLGYGAKKKSPAKDDDDGISLKTMYLDPMQESKAKMDDQLSSGKIVKVGNYFEETEEEK